MKFANLVLLVLTLTYISCDSSILYQKEHSVANPWKYDDPMVFDFEVDNVDSPCALLLALEYSNDFSYQNLYLKIQTQYPDGKKIEDVLSINLTDDMGGWLGRCSSGKCIVDVQLQQGFRFPSKGAYTITVFQHSRDENLSGVLSGEMTVSALENG